MPNYKDLGPFQRRADYDERSYVVQKVESTRQAFQKRIHDIESLSDTAMQKICLFSLLDCLAQEWGNYPVKNTRENFCNFIRRFQTQFSYLDKVEPVTLFYRIEGIIEKRPLYLGGTPEPEISIDSLIENEPSTISSVVSSEFSSLLRAYIRNKVGNEKADKLESEHTVLRLLYQLRSKATHEMNDLGREIPFFDDYNLNEPYYREMGNTDVVNGRVVSYETVELVIPATFLKTLFENCLDNYLNYCKTNNRIPFKNERNRTVNRLSWYDKQVES